MFKLPYVYISKFKTLNMSGAEIRQPGSTRTEYPPIRPGDKPRSINSKPNAPKALAEKPANSLNISSKPRTALHTKPTLLTESLKAQLKQTVQNAKHAPSKPTVKSNEPNKALKKPVVKKDGLQTPVAPKSVEAKAQSTVKEDQPKTQTQAAEPDPEPKVQSKPSKKRSFTSTDSEPASKKVKVDAPSESPSEQPTEKPSTKKSKADKTPTEKKTKGTSEKPTEKPKSFLEVIVPTHPNTGEIPIYDTCSTIRHKISTLLGKDNNKPENGVPGKFKKDGTPKPYTQAQFLRDIDGGSAASLKTFMTAKKLMGGAESTIYPSAYEFFEKKRIWEDGKKAKGRMKVEEE